MNLASNKVVNLIWLSLCDDIYVNDKADKIAKYAARESLSNMITARAVVRITYNCEKCSQNILNLLLRNKY